MAQVKCAICQKAEESSKMRYCDKCNIWVHYDCAGGTTVFFSPKCPQCEKSLG